MPRGGWNRGQRRGMTTFCQCGAEVYVSPCHGGRTKYCSNACKYRYRKRPSGLKYDVKVQNKGWFHLRAQQAQQ